MCPSDRIDAETEASEPTPPSQQQAGGEQAFDGEQLTTESVAPQSPADDGAGPADDAAGGDAAAVAASTATAEPTATAAPLAESIAASTALPVAPSRPTYVFLGVVAAISLFLDIASKGWAEVTLSRRGFEPIELIDGHLAVTLAYNQGGAWGLFANVGEHLRKPFFLVVSATAIWFIVSLYGRLARSQRALTWGLPLVLGGALGNLSDRITRSQVVDFIDYRAEWVLHTNAFISRRVGLWTVTDHWPTFNIADVAICIGVGLMAVDMFGSRKHGHGPESGKRRDAGPAETQLAATAEPPASEHLAPEHLAEPPTGPTVATAAD